MFPDTSCRFSKAGLEDNTGAELWTTDTNKLLCIMGTHGMELDTSAVGGEGGGGGNSVSCAGTDEEKREQI